MYAFSVFHKSYEHITTTLILAIAHPFRKNGELKDEKTRNINKSSNTRRKGN